MCDFDDKRLKKYAYFNLHLCFFNNKNTLIEK